MNLDEQIPEPDVLAQLEAVACDVARACGRLILEERPDDLAVAATKTSNVDVVTVMDGRSEQLASQLLRSLRPSDGQFGEEGLHEIGTSGITWVVDPIDGTVNYLYGIPDYAVSVAAVVGDPGADGAWLPVAGAVINPETAELFSAHRGGGARMERRGTVQELRTDPAEVLALTMLATGFSYEAEVRAEQGAALATIISKVRDVRRLGSAALDLCHVACGRVDAYYERLTHPWDVAAGWVIAEEAGASVRGLEDEHPTESYILAGKPEILDSLAQLLR